MSMLLCLRLSAALPGLSLSARNRNVEARFTCMLTVCSYTCDCSTYIDEAEALY